MPYVMALTVFQWYVFFLFDIVLTYGRPLVAGMAILVRKVCLKAGHFCDPIGLLVDLRLCDYPGGRSMWTRWNCHQCIDSFLGTMGVGPQLGCDTTRLYCIKVSAIRGHGVDCIWWVSHGETVFILLKTLRGKLPCVQTQMYVQCMIIEYW